MAENDARFLGEDAARFWRGRGGAGVRRAQGKAGSIIAVYQCAFSGVVRASTAAKMSTSTRMVFSIAMCALGVGAVGGLVVCLLSVLLL